MTVKEGDEYQDRYGRYYMTFRGYKSIADVYLWLQMHYSGYKFGILFDCTKDEIEEPDNTIYVYFLDELMEEVMHYSDFVKVDRDTYKRRTNT